MKKKLKRCFVIRVGDAQVVSRDCSYASGIYDLTSSLSAAKTWAKRATAQDFLDVANPKNGVSLHRARVVELGFVAPTPDEVCESVESLMKTFSSNDRSNVTGLVLHRLKVLLEV